MKLMVKRNFSPVQSNATTGWADRAFERVVWEYDMETHQCKTSAGKYDGYTGGALQPVWDYVNKLSVREFDEYLRRTRRNAGDRPWTREAIAELINSKEAT